LFPLAACDVSERCHDIAVDKARRTDIAQARRAERQSYSSGTIPHPPIVSHHQWLDARKKLLVHEKELTKHYDRMTAERRRLPMVKIDKDYVFDGPWEARLQGAIRRAAPTHNLPLHVRYPAWDKGCPNRTWYIDSLGDLSMLSEYDTTFALVSRAALAKIEAYKKQRGWDISWYSSFGTDFNYDFHVTNDPEVRPPEYNYRTLAENKAHDSPNNLLAEEHGLSVFFALEGDVFHTYSAYARGTELIADARLILDATPYGRRQEFEDSPPGWPQKPTYG
jgi:predicted dithiol-disulfide oxidoreductase (DUF899 family)